MVVFWTEMFIYNTSNTSISGRGTSLNDFHYNVFIKSYLFSRYLAPHNTIQKINSPQGAVSHVF